MPVTMPSSLVLAALLWYLRTTGWPFVDVDKLTSLYEAFQAQTGMLIYGNHFNRGRAQIRKELESDLVDLEKRGIVKRSVSRVQLTGPGTQSASRLSIPTDYEKLKDIAASIFPQKARS